MHCLLVHSMIQKQKIEFPLLLFIIVLSWIECACLRHTSAEVPRNKFHCRLFSTPRGEYLTKIHQQTQPFFKF